MSGSTHDQYLTQRIIDTLKRNGDFDTFRKEILEAYMNEVFPY